MKLALIILLFLVNITMLIASIPLSLDESIEVALENNKELQAQEKGARAAYWSQYNTLSNFFPQAYFNATAVRIDDKTYDRATEMFQIPVFGPNHLPTGDYIPFSAGAMNGIHRTTYRTNFTVQQPIFNGGKILLVYQISRLARQQADNALESKQYDVSQRVAEAYFNILKLKDMYFIIDKSMTSVESHLERVRQLQEQGMARQSDVLQWQVRLQEYLASSREVYDNIEIILELWNNMMGMTGKAYRPLEIDLSKYDELIDHYNTLNETQIEGFIIDNVKDLEKYNPEMQNIELTRKLMDKQYTISKGNFLPSLNLQFTYELENDDKLDLSGDRNWNLAAVLSFPLFRGGANYTNLQRARNEKREVEYATSALEDYMRLETRRLSRQLIINAMKIESNKLALDYARENYDILSNLFEQGLLTSSDLLDADTMLISAETNLIASYYDFIITRYELNKYTTLKEVK
ncbi:MAG: TolC family protein [Candidatus Cloacimonetes bacterium]|nr:TolC family protein [Candidatus Cloacimonadota bacterium]